MSKQGDIEFAKDDTDLYVPDRERLPLLLACMIDNTYEDMVLQILKMRTRLLDSSASGRLKEIYPRANNI